MTQNAIQKMTVVEVTAFTKDIIKLILKPSKDFEYHAGQYTTLGLEKTDLRPFSMASAPQKDGLLEFHIRLLHDNEWMASLFSVKKGITVYVDAPKNQYSIDSNNDKQNIILIAGGTGFAPMKALLEALLIQNKKQIIKFYWGVNHVSDLYSNQEMLDFCKKNNQLKYIPVVSKDTFFKGQKGLVHQIVLLNHPDLSNYRVYLCGPWEMQKIAKEDFLKAGLTEKQFN